ncbi:tRNA uridine(34) 5-carboxymethylaminomethyl modification radical SAM/GNAT enzyme Elp3 [Candidatus Parcubacteria bacterium]|nr:tRNA uridine(34) 5-carboxymethylaminomethyl modification radical SAM/GNAT enzyme Elp3 [Candidatus Parcubacteria bacterium]
MDKQNIKSEIILELLNESIKTEKDLMLVKRKIAKKYKINIPSNANILREYSELVKTKKVKDDDKLKLLLRKRAVRTMSGIAPVAILTKPWKCPGNCVFCPTEKNVPQSYLSNEPAVMRAIRCDYNPYIQIQDRLQALIANGHEPTKIELIVIGGTWSVLPKKYKYWYILNCYKSANEFNKIWNKKNTNHQKLKFNISNLQFPISKPLSIIKEQLIIEQKKNEKSKYKIIGLTLETRPDYIDEDELWQMREFGCTRVEIGVQTIDDKILKLNKRGHGVDEISKATKLLRNFGFKITYHLMPGLPGSTANKDYKMFKQLFSNPKFQPDQIKFYPTVVTKGSLLYKWWKSGKYKPYSNKVLQNLIVKCKQIIPPYVRIIRLIRDIPGESIEAGNKITNLRQIMKDMGVKCNCIRCRESKNQKVSNIKLSIMNYDVSDGIEHFISFENFDKKILYGFCRLYIPKNSNPAIIRELHVYGQLISVGSKTKKTQHSGLGKKLMEKAEEIAKQNNKERVSIISGVGVRGYYRKFGYKLNNSYMIKKI